MPKQRFRQINTTAEQRSSAVDDAHTTMEQRVAEKGSLPFSSNYEALGALEQEIFELRQAIQEQNWDAVRAEWRDVAVTALFAMVSMDAQGEPSTLVIDAREVPCDRCPKCGRVLTGGSCHCQAPRPLRDIFDRNLPMGEAASDAERCED